VLLGCGGWHLQRQNKTRDLAWTRGKDQASRIAGDVEKGQSERMFDAEGTTFIVTVLYLGGGHNRNYIIHGQREALHICPFLPS